MLIVTRLEAGCIVGEDGRICYGIGGSEPLNLDQVADLLAIECDHCYRAFEAFQALVAEHSAAITAFDLGSQDALFMELLRGNEVSPSGKRAARSRTDADDG